MTSFFLFSLTSLWDYSSALNSFELFSLWSSKGYSNFCTVPKFTFESKIFSFSPSYRVPSLNIARWHLEWSCPRPIASSQYCSWSCLGGLHSPWYLTLTSLFFIIIISLAFQAFRVIDSVGLERPGKIGFKFGSGRPFAGADTLWSQIEARWLWDPALWMGS